MSIRCGSYQIFVDRESGKYLPSFRHHTDAGASDLVGGKPRDLAAIENNPSSTRRSEAHDRAHGGRFAHAVSADEGHRAAFAQLQVNSEKNLLAAVESLDVDQLKHIWVTVFRALFQDRRRAPSRRSGSRVACRMRSNGRYRVP